MSEPLPNIHQSLAPSNFRLTQLDPNKHCVDWGELGPPLAGDKCLEPEHSHADGRCRVCGLVTPTYTVALQDWAASKRWRSAEENAVLDEFNEPIEYDYFRALARSTYMAGAQQAAAKLYAELSGSIAELDLLILC